MATALIALGVPAKGSALTLADLTAPGATLSLGRIQISDVHTLVTGQLSSDLSVYGVQALDDGFRVSGGLITLAEQVGTLTLSYTVTADTGIEISGALLIADGFVLEDGSYVVVSETFLTVDPIDSLEVYSIGGDGSVTSAMRAFPVRSELDVVTTIQLGGGMLATAPFVDQGFATVPEPSTALMLLLGLIGLAWSGSRSDCRASRQSDGHPRHAPSRHPTAW